MIRYDGCMAYLEWFLDLPWMYVVMFFWSIINVCHSVSLISDWCMPCVSLICLDVSLTVLLIYHGCICFKVSLFLCVWMPLCFFDLSWRYASVFSWFIMTLCISNSLMYHGCMPQCFFDQSRMYALRFLWSTMDVSLMYHRCMPIVIVSLIY